MNKLLKMFREKYANSMQNDGLRAYNYNVDVGDGVTVGENDGNAFNLNDPAELKIDKVHRKEVVKRLKISKSQLADIIKDRSLFSKVFGTLDAYMLSQGVSSYTYNRPDGGTPLRVSADEKSVEIRAYGYKD